MHLKSSPRSRGSAILFVVVALAILAVIGLAAVEFTGRDMGVARTTQRKSAVERCAAAAKQFMIAQYRQSAGNVPANTQLEVAFNTAGGDATVRLLPSEVLPTHSSPNSRNQRRDITNTLWQGTGQGTGISGAVHCIELTPAFPDGGGRESEFEIYVQANQ